MPCEQAGRHTQTMVAQEPERVGTALAQGRGDFRHPWRARTQKKSPVDAASRPARRRWEGQPFGYRRAEPRTAVVQSVREDTVGAEPVGPVGQP